MIYIATGVGGLSLILAGLFVHCVITWLDRRFDDRS